MVLNDTEKDAERQKTSNDHCTVTVQTVQGPVKPEEPFAASLLRVISDAHRADRDLVLRISLSVTKLVEAMKRHAYVIYESKMCQSS